jgi:hypothetical protein
MAAAKCLEIQLTVDVPGLATASEIIVNKGRTIEYQPEGYGDVVRITQEAGGRVVWLVPTRSVAWMKVG